MDKKRFLQLMLLLAFLLIAGCSSDNDGMDDAPVAVQFGTGNIAGPGTRTTAGGAQWVQGDKVGIFMVRNGQPLSAATIAGDADNVEYRANTGGSNNTGFSPVSGIPIYYPQNGDAVDFIACYPYKTPLTDYEYPIDVTNQSDASTIDVLYANSNPTQSGSGYNKASGTVDLQFRHALSKLNFTLKSGTVSPDLTGATLQISNIATSGTMDLADGTVTTTNSGQTLTANTANNGLSSSAITIPQSLSAAKLTVTLADGVSKFEWDFDTPEWEAGLQYPYTITVDRTGITVTTGDITDWTGTSNLPTEGVGGIFYEVGDYYPDPSNSATAIGVVFWVDPSDGRHGKVVGLQEASSVAWSSAYSTTNATDMANGRANMRTIYNLANDFSGYPAFKWIHEMNPSGTDYSDDNATNVWYLPARDELGNNDAKSLYVAYNTYGKTYFNSKLTAAGGTVLSDNYYWSSSENDLSYAWFVGFLYGTTFYDDKNDDYYRARCVLAF